MTNFCNNQPGNPCSGKNHQYQNTITIKSPSNRSSSCSHPLNIPSPGQPASQPVNWSCETQLLINGEDGDYTIESSPYDTCDIVGPFFTTPIATLISITHAACDNLSITISKR